MCLVLWLVQVAVRVLASVVGAGEVALVFVSGMSDIEDLHGWVTSSLTPLLPSPTLLNPTQQHTSAWKAPSWRVTSNP